ncbi:Thiol:disulfide interchange protein DsbD [Metallosphaera sp. J1]|uniref:thioredoxin domain-containing protein n=1 Tax=Metallosphaera javensis (ex Hofmann et al. 2022) TaxID=99938 RepID=UPI001EE0E315|nr:thioredoxin domain-containing protein [Metallosphaera javensis (ex Hofmann et al. 2022)]MCG3109247.1 Thiol:disulfide interchange protein DsbD [Metallosphaera javensis (ex Hofmann et al. 2022)]
MNRLKDSSSAFLRESAEQEIDWYPWSDEAFQRAKQDDKPILVDVGAVWCHWCHVMDRETYSRRDIAELVNRHFVAIKVDRDEMPELDRKLQRAVSSITGESGWPLTVFMTPEGEVFFGGTFFPPEDSYGRVGMKRLLLEIVRLWIQDRERLKRSALSLADYAPSTSSPLDLEIVDTAFSSIVSTFDIEQGGLSGTMKFPHPLVDQFLTAYSFWTGDHVGIKLSIFTLKKMFQGGIFDQLGGGFHRYAVDREWNVPHFEKLLIDNAELLEDYFVNYLASGDPQLRDAVEMTSQFVLRDMWVGEGFASSLDADVDGKEGGFYTWDWDELLSNSGEWRSLIERTFTLVGEGALEGGVLRVRDDLGEIAKTLNMDVKTFLENLRKARERLRAYRDSTRRKPFRDDNLYTYPNCRMADSLLRSSVLTGKGREEGVRVASKLSRRVTRRLQGGGEGLLEDYSSALLLALRAYEVSGDLRFKDLALELGKEVLDFMTPNGFVEKRGSSEVPNMDTPNESPNSLALRGLLSLSLLDDQIKVPENVISSILGDYMQGPPFYAGSILSAGALLKGMAHIVVVDADEKASSLHRESLLLYHPFKVVELVKEENRDMVVPLIRSMINQGQGSRVFVCVGNTCSIPVREPEKIKLLLKSKLPQ